MSVWRTVVTMQSPVLGGIGTNTWHARAPDFPNATITLEQLTQDLAAFYVDLESIYTGGTVVSNDGIWVSVDEEETVQTDTPPWTLAATGADDSLPPATALVVGWRTSSPTRRGRGRTFLGPIAQSINEGNGTPGEPAREQVHTAIDTFIATFTPAGDGAFCIWSEADQVARDIVSGRTRNLFGSLRSRRD